MYTGIDNKHVSGGGTAAKRRPVCPHIYICVSTLSKLFSGCQFNCKDMYGPATILEHASDRHGSTIDIVFPVVVAFVAASCEAKSVVAYHAHVQVLGRPSSGTCAVVVVVAVV